MPGRIIHRLRNMRARTMLKACGWMLAALVALGALGWTQLRVSLARRMFADLAIAAAPGPERRIGVAGGGFPAARLTSGEAALECVTVDAAALTTSSAAGLPALIAAPRQGREDWAGRMARLGYRPAFSGWGPLAGWRAYLKRAEEAEVTSAALSFAVMGDVGMGDRGERRVGRCVRELSERVPLTAVMLLGDNIYQKDSIFYYPETFESEFEQSVVAPLRGLFEKRIPFYAVLGNHDYRRPHIRQGELETPLLHMAGRPYYQKTFTDGGCSITFFMMLGETLDEEREQTDWLRERVKACTSEWKVLLTHRPLLSSDGLSHEGDAQAYRRLRKILRGPGGIDMTLSGHNHIYERRRAVDGVSYVTIGNSGDLDDWTKFKKDRGRASGYSARRCYGWLRASKSALKWEVRNEDGKLIDRVSLKPKP